MNENFIITKIERIILVGKDEYEEKVTKFSNHLPYNELIFHLSGRADIYFGGKVFSTNPGDVRLLPKGDTSEYIADRQEKGECIDIFFETNAPVSHEAFVLKPQNTEALKNLFKKIFSIWVAKNEGYYFECISLLYRILAELQKEDYIPEHQYNAIRPAVEYIREHFLDSKISVSHLAKLCGISESYLKRLFGKKFGMSPMKYLIQMRINYACDLLQSGLYSVTQTAELCRYNNVYYFSRQFKEYTGITPSEFMTKYKSSK